MTRAAPVLAFLTVMASNHVGLERPAGEADLLRAFAFGACLAEAYDKTPFGADAERVADAYFHMGHISRPEVYDEIRKLAASLDAAKPSVVEGHNLAIMACLEFYEGARLRQIARRAAAPSAKK